MSSWGPHTHFSRGKRVRVVLRDGTAIIGKFLERTSLYVVLDSGRIRTNRLKSVTLAKHA